MLYQYIRCGEFIEHLGPRFVANHLVKLQISCIYQSNGCEELVSYEVLEKHETHCDYRPQECSGCKLQMLKKDLNEQETHCPMVESTCPNCKIVCKQFDATALHTDLICAREQLRQLQEKVQLLDEKNKENLQEHKRTF
ncbi:unnamed protein product [Rotaria socialis]|uniref:TRAF-type domain-containing protein n=1 Tax=Rotaria socialis TaxID=392032 RepID=A0A817XF41_9BILA|nr:unnamed protein product [Rotaria socialis]